MNYTGVLLLLELLWCVGDARVQHSWISTTVADASMKLQEDTFLKNTPSEWCRSLLWLYLSITTTAAMAIVYHNLKKCELSHLM